MSNPARRPTPDALASVVASRATADGDVRQAPSTAEPSEQDGPAILSVDQMIALYRGEWVLMRVTAVEDPWPSHGEVVAHSVSRATILEAWAGLARGDTPNDRYYVFPASDRIQTGAQLREALEVLQQTWDGEVVRAWPRW